MTGNEAAAWGGRVNQKTRTRRGIVEACRELIRGGAEITMPRIAERALVSEATAYRYFPDLASAITEAMDGIWPEPAQALAPVAGSDDPVKRVAFACGYLLRGVHAIQGSVRAMMAYSIVSPGRARERPGVRFGLIEYALAPFAEPGGPAFPGAAAIRQLKLDLAVVVSAEALFVLTDLCGLPADDAIASAVRTAATLTRAAFAG
jgi:AcrR family transcriptional regulator